MRLWTHKRMRAAARLGIFLGIGLTAVGLRAQSVKDQLPPELPMPRDTGDSIQPVFDGWQRNADGTISMWFGYLNRNRKEIVDVPVGPANKFNVTSGTAVDSGQP